MLIATHDRSDDPARRLPRWCSAHQHAASNYRNDLTPVGAAAFTNAPYENWFPLYGVEPGDRSVGVSGREGFLRLNVNPSTWSPLACDVAGRNLTRAEWNAYFPGSAYRKTCAQYA